MAGWSYQWISELPWAPDSWTAPLDARRIPVGADITAATATQVRDLVTLPDDGAVPMLVFDASYDPIALTHELADTRAQLLVRIRDDRVFYTDPPERTDGTVGGCGHSTPMAPPSMVMLWPLMYPAASETRNSQSAANSSGAPTRPAGTASTNSCRTSATLLPVSAA